MFVAVPQNSDCRMRISLVGGYRQNALGGREIEPERDTPLTAVYEGLAE